MTTTHPTGLGEPDPPGKLSLFRPPEQRTARPEHVEVSTQPILDSIETSQKRIRTTVDLTWEALQVIESVQRQHRLQTGKVLPLWKAVSQMIESCGKRIEKKNPGKTIH